MTAQSRTALKAVFEQGDTPQGSDFANLIDSPLNLADTSAQTVVSHVTFSGGANIATLSAASISIVAATVGSAKIGALGVGTAAPAAGIFIASSSESSISLDVTTTAIASGGTGGAVPASAQGFLIVRINGASFRVPFFNVK